VNAQQHTDINKNDIKAAFRVKTQNERWRDRKLQSYCAWKELKCKKEKVSKEQRTAAKYVIVLQNNADLQNQT
jgi:hypothetical protein